MGLFDLFKRPRPKSRPPVEPVMRSLPEPAPADAPDAARSAPPPSPPDSMELRRMLFDAIATGDEEKLARLCRDHHDFLLAYADTWSIVPDALNANPEAAKWYGEGLQAIARFCADRLNRPELRDRLGDGGAGLPAAPPPRDARHDAYAA